MKQFIILAFISLLAQSISAQDLIIANDGDSIQCRITDIKDGNIYFTFKHEDEIRNTLISLPDVKMYYRDYYKDVNIPEGKNVSGDYKHVRVALNFGYSYQLAPVSKDVPDEFYDYVKELKSGFSFGGELTIFFSESVGMGAKYTQFSSKNRINRIGVQQPDNSWVYGPMSDDLKVSFIGPALTTRFLSANKSNAFLMSFTVGYMGYSNNKVIINKANIKGSTVGFGIDLGYDIGIDDNLAIGFQLSLIGGTLSKYELSNKYATKTGELDSGEREGLGRIDLSIGLRFQ